MGYLQQEGHLQGQGEAGVKQPPNLDQLISLLQRSQVRHLHSCMWRQQQCLCSSVLLSVVCLSPDCFTEKVVNRKSLGV